MTNIGVAFAGGNGKRRADDFYPTPPEATRALIEACFLGTHTRAPIWEPACGDGAMARELEAAGFRVVATDLIDRGYGEGGVDFLRESTLRGSRIVTNPPFNLAAEFIAHAMGALQAQALALLLKVSFFNAARRLPLFEKFPPAVVAPLTWRLDFDGRGAPTMDCMWVVWGAGYAPGTTRFIPLRKPAPIVSELEDLLA